MFQLLKDIFSQYYIILFLSHSKLASSLLKLVHNPGHYHPLMDSPTNSTLFSLKHDQGPHTLAHTHSFTLIFYLCLSHTHNHTHTHTHTDTHHVHACMHTHRHALSQNLCQARTVK